MTAHFTSIDPQLFVTGTEHLTLQGSRCLDCSTVIFPSQESCARCAGLLVEPHALATDGTLWAYTVQRFAPKPPYLCPPEGFRPYGVGYVDLGHEVLVESRLTVADPDLLHIGQQVRLVAETLVDSNGLEFTTFAFEPIAAGAS